MAKKVSKKVKKVEKKVECVPCTVATPSALEQAKERYAFLLELIETLETNKFPVSSNIAVEVQQITAKIKVLELE